MTAQTVIDVKTEDGIRLIVAGDDLGIVTEHTVYDNNLDHVLDNSFHPIYLDQS